MRPARTEQYVRAGLPQNKVPRTTMKGIYLRFAICDLRFAIPMCITPALILPFIYYILDPYGGYAEK
jgi:hypothetical protein